VDCCHVVCGAALKFGFWFKVLVLGVDVERRWMLSYE